MSNSLLPDDDETLEELIQSVLDEEPGTCIKCGHKMIQQYKTKWDQFSTEIKMKCYNCGHTASDERKLLS